MRLTTLTALAALAALGACGDKDATNGAAAPAAPVAAVAPPAGTKWTETFAKTADDGMLMGNPNAPIKLVEYGSLTCSHCAEFSAKGAEPLKAMIDTGKVSWEFRNFVRDPLDVTASLLARCSGPGPFFPLMEQMFADQPNWFAKMQALPADQANALSALPPGQQRLRYAELLGLGEFAKQRGVPDAKGKACMADDKAAEALVANVNAATKAYPGIPGTPAFVINGSLVPNAASWETLEPALKAAGA